MKYIIALTLIAAFSSCEVFDNSMPDDSLNESSAKIATCDPNGPSVYLSEIGGTYNNNWYLILDHDINHECRSKLNRIVEDIEDSLGVLIPRETLRIKVIDTILGYNRVIFTEDSIWNKKINLNRYIHNNFPEYSEDGISIGVFKMKITSDTGVDIVTPEHANDHELTLLFYGLLTGITY